MSVYQKQSGLTLIELMMAILLSLMLGAGAYTMYEGTKSASKTQADLARLQENARYGITRLINAVSSAGYMGCNRSAYKANSTITNAVAVSNGAGSGWAPDFSEPIQGVDGAAGAADTLTLIWAKAEYSIFVNGQSGPTAPIRVPANKQYRNMVEITDLEQGDIVSVSNCEAISVFMITNAVVPAPSSANVNFEHVVGAIGGIANAAAGIQYSAFGDPTTPAYVRKVEALQFSLASKTIDGKNVSSLYARGIGDAAPGDELIEGVEDFQVEYGEDLTPFDGSADRYVGWSNSLESQRITSVRLTLRVNSGRPMTDSSGAAGSDDLVKDMVFTVKLRNRGGVL